MEVVHALWDGSSPVPLVLWAETSKWSAASLGHRALARQHKSRNPRRHPYSLPQADLVELSSGLSRVVDGIPGSEDRSDLVLLPTTGDGVPVPSPELVGAERPEGPPEGLTPWRVETARLEPSGSMDLLLGLPVEPPKGVAYGSTLRFWTEAAKLSLEMVARGRFLPTVVGPRDGGHDAWRAAWEVVLDGEDAGRMEVLLSVMPPACHVSLPPGEGTAWNPRGLLKDFLDRMVDATVRDSIPPRGTLPPRRGRPPKHVPPAEMWIQALTSAEPRLVGPPEELGGFADDVDAWVLRRGTADPDAQLRTCFRLVAPGWEEGGESTDDDPGDGEGWHLGYCLQARDDPSLLVEAEAIWGARPDTRSFLGRRFEDPQERLLADLGRASRHFPRIEASLDEAHPGGLDMDAEGAYEFMRRHAHLLEQAGFGVLLPSWWRRPSARLSTRLSLGPAPKTSVASGLLGMEAVVAYEWRVAVGDETLTLEEFERLARMKVPLVRVRGRWAELRPEEVERAIAYFRRHDARGEMALAEALRLGLGFEAPEVGLEVTGVEGDGWVGDLLGGLSGGTRLPRVNTPRSLRGRLRPYQRVGLSWLFFLDGIGLGGCLADDMGLGKTVQLIALLLRERSRGLRGAVPGPTLVVCPMSVVGNWNRELQRFAPSLRTMVHHGVDRLSGTAFAESARDVDVVLTTYALAGRDEDTLSQVHWHRVVLDEAQNIKNSAAKQTRAIKRLRAARRVALTGTPVENRLAELWSIMDFLDPGYLGREGEFRRAFAIPVERYRDPGRAETLRRLVQPFVLRRMKTDRSIIRDLPEKVEATVYCNLTGEQGTLYEAVVTEMLDRIEGSEGIERKGLVLATLTKLKQVCNHPAQFLHDGSALGGRSGKLERLEGMLEEALAGGDRALVFTQFREMGGMLRSRLSEVLDREVLFLHGGTPKGRRDAMVQRFQDAREGPPVFVLSLKAGGTGLNLTAAQHVFHFDRWWNPAVEDQATDRAYRIGQGRNVFVHKFVCAGTMEERIDQLIDRKRELAETVIGTGEGWVTEMSTDQLRELFALSRETVGGD